ncbi:MAG: DNA-binding response regulator CtrA, partial [uncultured Sphingomonas sp.]
AGAADRGRADDGQEHRADARNGRLQRLHHRPGRGGPRSRQAVRLRYHPPGPEPARHARLRRAEEAPEQQGHHARADPVRHRRDGFQGPRPGLRRRRLCHQAVPPRRAGRPHPRHRPPVQGPQPVGDPHRQAGGQPRCQDGRGRRQPRAPDRQGICDAGAAVAPQGDDADQGDVPQSSLRGDGRARAQDHRRVHLQAQEEAEPGVRRRQLHRDGVGPRLRAAGLERERDGGDGGGV